MDTLTRIKAFLHEYRMVNGDFSPVIAAGQSEVTMDDFNYIVKVLEAHKSLEHYVKSLDERVKVIEMKYVTPPEQALYEAMRKFQDESQNVKFPIPRD